MRAEQLYSLFQEQNFSRGSPFDYLYDNFHKLDKEEKEIWRAVAEKISKLESGMKAEDVFKKILNDHIVVEIADFRYQGLIAIPESAKRSPTKGKVIAKADNVEEVELGDIVLYSQFAGYPLQFQGKTLMRVIGTSEVIAILNEAAPEIDV